MLGLVCSRLGRGGASKQPPPIQGPAGAKICLEWYQMDANEAKWEPIDAFPEPVRSGPSTDSKKSYIVERIVSHRGKRGTAALFRYRYAPG